MRFAAASGLVRDWIAAEGLQDNTLRKNNLTLCDILYENLYITYRQIIQEILVIAGQIETQLRKLAKMYPAVREKHSGQGSFSGTLLPAGLSRLGG